MIKEPPEHIVNFAIEESIYSPCQSKRGVAIFDGENLVSLGHNRKPVGFECTRNAACKASCGREAVHAEQYALLYARKVGGCEMLHVKTVDGLLVPSGGPSCLECSKLILASGLAAMWLYHTDGWRRYSAHDFHRLTLENCNACEPPGLVTLVWNCR